MERRNGIFGIKILIYFKNVKYEKYRKYSKKF